MWRLFAFTLLAVARAGYYEELTARQLPEIVKQNPMWKAGYNKRFANKSKEELIRMLGAKLDKTFDAPIAYPQVKPGAELPDTFDARLQWPQCPLIGFIRDQADCGSCWAVSSSAAMGDRACISSNGSRQLYLSDEDVMTCCPFCGNGCEGGYPLMAWRYWQIDGVVTGGPYNSRQGCQPYLISPNGQNDDTPACQKTCQSGYPESYVEDKHFGSGYYQVGNGVTGMQQELLKNGPIVSAFYVYEDFYNYVSGVYHHVSGEYVGGHAVKVVGWGVEDNTSYWLVANSWNASWGMDGFFKIIRGVNDCKFEQSITAGEAK